MGKQKIQPTKNNESAILLFMMAISFVVFCLNLNNPFFYSEYNGLLTNNRYESFEALFNDFSWNLLFQRPLSILTYFTNFTLFGKSPWGFHLFNILIHLANVFLMWKILKLLKPRIALVASGIFLVHPLVNSVVAQIYSRNYALGSMFILLAVLFAVDERKKEKPWKSVVFGICAVLSKQVFVLHNFLLWVFVTPKWGKNVKIILGILSFVVAVIFVNRYAIKLSSSAFLDWDEFFLSQFGNFDLFLKLYFTPFSNALVHNPPVHDFFSYKVILGMLLLFSVTIAVFRSKDPFFRWTYVLFILTIVPTNSVFPKDDVLREWRLYPSLVIFCPLIAQIAVMLLDRWKWAWVRKASLGFLCAWVLACWSSHAYQASRYQTESEAWRQVLEMYPESPDVYLNLSIIVKEEGDMKLSEEYVRKAIAMNPENEIYYYNLAILQTKLGRNEEAKQTMALYRKFSEKRDPVHFNYFR